MFWIMYFSVLSLIFIIGIVEIYRSIKNINWMKRERKNLEILKNLRCRLAMDYLREQANKASDDLLSELSRLEKEFGSDEEL